jgi:hypothetical protein
MGNFFKRLYMAARGQEPYRPYCHDDVEFKIGRYTARFDWVTYSRRRWFTRQKHSGTPRIRIKFEVPQQPNWDEMPLATHLDYKSSPVESYFEVGFLLRSAKDLRNYLHWYFLDISSISKDCAVAIGGELTDRELDFMVNLMFELEARPTGVRKLLESNRLMETSR